MIFKYVDTGNYHENICNYIKIYNSSRFSEIYLMTRIDILKQYLSDPSVAIYENGEGENINSFL